MAKTIAEVSEAVAILLERLDGLRREVASGVDHSSKNDESLNAVNTKLAVLEERLNELKKGLEEATRRRWSVLPSVVGGLVGGILGFLGHLVVRLLLP